MPTEQRMPWPVLEASLRDRGFKYLGFISFARDRPPADLVTHALNIKNAIESELKLYLDTPQLFFDDEAIHGGDYIEPNLASGICRSACVIAVCAPVYFDRPYCGREWAAMDQLCAHRFPEQHLRRAIIPILLRKPDPLPPVLSGDTALKFYDCSAGSVGSRNYFAGSKFRKLAIELVERMRTFAEALVDADARCDGDDFQLPARSAFAGYSLNPSPFPLHARARGE